MTISQLQSDLRSGKETLATLLDLITDRADREDPAIWIHRLTREELQTYVDRIQGQEDLPLYGIPFAIKDNIDLEGVPTTAACPEFAYTPARSATVVQRLIEAGAIPIGKTNLDQFATGLVGVRSPYGVPGNAFDPKLIPGGSSSGSAVAVAKGLVSFALGTDTAGSGRVPAALNHLIGLKPTCGLLSTKGVVPACRTLDCVSIFATTVNDTHAVLQVAQGFDSQDPYSRPPSPIPQTNPSPLRVAIPRRDQWEFFDDPHSKAAFQSFCERAAASDWTLTEIDFSPFLEIARLLYEGPWVAERYAAILPFIESHPDALHPTTRQIIENGRNFSAIEVYQAYYQLQRQRRALETFWDTADLLVTPTVGTTYTIEDVRHDPVRLNSNLGYYTNFMNLLDLAAIAVPASIMENGRPFGVTLAAPAFSEPILLQSAALLREESLASIHPPLHDLPCRLAVCGAHLHGLPLHHQLEDRGAVLVERTTTSPHYRLYALPNTSPAKPGMIRDESEQGGTIEIEIYALSTEAFGSFVSAIPAPLGIGRIETASGDNVSGFLCEPYALQGATEVTHLGSWRTYLTHQAHS